MTVVVNQQCQIVEMPFLLFATCCLRAPRRCDGFVFNRIAGELESISSEGLHLTNGAPCTVPSVHAPIPHRNTLSKERTDWDGTHTEIFTNPRDPENKL